MAKESEGWVIAGIIVLGIIAFLYYQGDLGSTIPENTYNFNWNNYSVTCYEDSNSENFATSGNFYSMITSGSRDYQIRKQAEHSSVLKLLVQGNGDTTPHSASMNCVINNLAISEYDEINLIINGQVQSTDSSSSGNTVSSIVCINSLCVSAVAPKGGTDSKSIGGIIIKKLNKLDKFIA